MIESIQFGSSLTCSSSLTLSILDCSRYLTNIRPSELNEVVASQKSTSVRAFSVLKMWEISKYVRVYIRSFTFWRYFIITEFRTSNSSLTYPIINYESVKTFKLSMSNSLTIFKPTRRASYSTWLFEALKLNRRAYSVTILSKLMRMRSALLSCVLDAPSICNMHIDVELGLGVSTNFILSFDSFSGLLLGIVHTLNDEVSQNLCLHRWT